MIKLFRIDERLIHGQIAIKWSRHTGVDSIVVANDNAASNVMIQKSLKMAAPPGVKTVIKTIDDAVKTLNDPRCEPLKVLVLVNNPEDAVEMVTQVSGVPFVNRLLSKMRIVYNSQNGRKYGEEYLCNGASGFPESDIPFLW